jgi:hypothetical protein
MRTLAWVSVLQAATQPRHVKQQAETCEGLRAYLHEELAPVVCAFESKGAHWGIVVALFCRAATTYQASVRLARDGFGAEAGMLNRALFEATIDCYWTTECPSLAVERLRDHIKYEAYDAARLTLKYPEKFADVDLPEPQQLSDDERKRLEKLYRSGSSSWTGLNLYQRVQQVASYWPDEWDQANLRYFLDIPNSLHNKLLHPTAWGLSRATTPASAPDGSRGVAYRLGPGDDFCGQALFGAYWTASQLARLMLRECELDEQTFRQEMFERGIRSFLALTPEGSRTLGRNSACPCGSGRKVKHCHGR